MANGEYTDAIGDAYYAMFEGRFVAPKPAELWHAMFAAYQAGLLSEGVLPDNVVELPVITLHDLDPNRVLANAVDKLATVIVIGERKDGDEYFAASMASGPEALWLMERFKYHLIRTPDADA